MTPIVLLLNLVIIFAQAMLLYLAVSQLNELVAFKPFIVLSFLYLIYNQNYETLILKQVLITFLISSIFISIFAEILAIIYPGLYKSYPYEFNFLSFGTHVILTFLTLMFIKFSKKLLIKLMTKNNSIT